MSINEWVREWLSLFGPNDCTQLMLPLKKKRKKKEKKREKTTNFTNLYIYAYLFCGVRVIADKMDEDNHLALYSERCLNFFNYSKFFVNLW